MKTEESAENYLETILILRSLKGEVRSIDVAKKMNFTKPSVSVAMKNLRLKEYIVIDENGFIEFTEKGRKKAVRVYERHTTIREFLIRIGVDEKIASEDACRIEHVISEESLNAIKRLLKGSL